MSGSESHLGVCAQGSLLTSTDHGDAPRASYIVRRCGGVEGRAGSLPPRCRRGSRCTRTRTFSKRTRDSRAMGALATPGDASVLHGRKWRRGARLRVP